MPMLQHITRCSICRSERRLCRASCCYGRVSFCASLPKIEVQNNHPISSRKGHSWWLVPAAVGGWRGTIFRKSYVTALCMWHQETKPREETKRPRGQDGWLARQSLRHCTTDRWHGWHGITGCEGLVDALDAQVTNASKPRQTWSHSDSLPALLVTHQPNGLATGRHCR